MGANGRQEEHRFIPFFPFILNVLKSHFLFLRELFCFVSWYIEHRIQCAQYNTRSTCRSSGAHNSFGNYSQVFCVSLMLRAYKIKMILMYQNCFAQFPRKTWKWSHETKLFGIYRAHSGCISELWDLNRTSIFRSPFGYLGLHVTLLDEYQERLFVGGRDLVYSLSLDRVSENYREVQ